MLTKKCIVCGKTFYKTPSISLNYWHNKKKFCSLQCYWKNKKGRPAWNKGKKCPQLSGKNNHFFGKIILGENNPSWKGGIRKSSGRRYIYKPEHPFVRKDKYVSQSHLIAEKCLGRYLKPEEVIHHINGIKDDDRPENLYLFATKGKHTQHHGWKIKPELKSNLLKNRKE